MPEEPQRYSTIVADPPWRYTSAATKADAGKHYATMALDDILLLGARVGNIAASDSHLWLWTTNAFIEEGYKVVRAWGFKPLTVLTWCKKQPGVGYYLRNNTEHCILASRGKPQVPVEKAISSWYVWPRGAHSAKPDEFMRLVEQVSPGPYLELFAREYTPLFPKRAGWDVWGNEVAKDVEMFCPATADNA